MKLNLTKKEVTLAIGIIDRIVMAGKKKNLKENSTDIAVLNLNEEILQKLIYAYSFDQHSDEAFLDLNRRQAKVFIASMMFSLTLCEKAKNQYAEIPSTDERFSNEPGRKKEDYIMKAEDKIKDASSILTKIRRAL